MTHLPEHAQLLLEIAKLRQIIDEQTEQIAALLTENQELKEKLGANSSNSSKPPSQDPNRKSRRSESTGKKPGGQPGHAGHRKTIYPPEKVTKTVEIRPEICPGVRSGLNWSGCWLRIFLLRTKKKPKKSSKFIDDAG